MSGNKKEPNWWDEDQGFPINWFHASQIFSMIGDLGNQAIEALKETWGDGWKSNTLFFPFKLIKSVSVLALGGIASAIIATIGSVTAGIIGGSIQSLFGVGQILSGLVSLNGERVIEGAKNLFIGTSKIVVGSSIAASIALATMSGIGSVALPFVAPVTTLIHPVLVGLATTIASSATYIAATVAAGIVATSIISGISMLIGKKISSKQAKAQTTKPQPIIPTTNKLDHPIRATRPQPPEPATPAPPNSTLANPAPNANPENPVPDAQPAVTRAKPIVPSGR